MNAIAYYSNTNQSKHIAEYFNEKLNYELIDITKNYSLSFENLVVVFPVHCQNMPEPVSDFLDKITVKNLTLIASYGRMCYGNVLYEAQKSYSHNIVAGAYIPTKHTYLTEGSFNEFERLDVIVEKIKNPISIQFPKEYKNPFANLLKGLRSRMVVKIIKSSDCNNCGICGKICINHAVKNGRTNRKCIRCLKCIVSCPNKALSFKISLPLKLYLSKKKTNELKIYL